MVGQSTVVFSESDLWPAPWTAAWQQPQPQYGWQMPSMTTVPAVPYAMPMSTLPVQQVFGAPASQMTMSPQQVAQVRALIAAEVRNPPSIIQQSKQAAHA